MTVSGVSGPRDLSSSAEWCLFLFHAYPCLAPISGRYAQIGLCALKTKQTLLFLFLLSLWTDSQDLSCTCALLPHPARLAPAEMQTQKVPGRKRGRPPLHSTPVQMAVHNLYSASAGSVPAVTIPKKRGRKPRYKVCLHYLLLFSRLGLGHWGIGQSLMQKAMEGRSLGKDRLGNNAACDRPGLTDCDDTAHVLLRALFFFSFVTSGESE